MSPEPQIFPHPTVSLPKLLCPINLVIQQTLIRPGLVLDTGDAVVNTGAWSPAFREHTVLPLGVGGAYHKQVITKPPV